MGKKGPKPKPREFWEERARQFLVGEITLTEGQRAVLIRKNALPKTRERGPYPPEFYEDRARRFMAGEIVLTQGMRAVLIKKRLIPLENRRDEEKDRQMARDYVEGRIDLEEKDLAALRKQGLLPPSRLEKMGLGVFWGCRTCKLFKPVAAFYFNKITKSYQPHCKPCANEIAKFNNKKNDRRKRYQWRVRLKIIEAYGGECVCCKERNPEFLTIDHIGGGGNVHRRSVGGSSFGVYKDLIRRGFPKDKYRLLCYNCNCAIGARGYCPHQLQKKEGVPSQ